MKKEIIPSDTRYVPLTQQKWCCVPVCIEMVMLRHNIPLIPLELLGYYLGLIVPKDQLVYFWNGRTGKEPESGYGTQITKAEFSPNKVFEKLNIPLKMKFKFIDEFNNLKSFNKYLKCLEEADSSFDILVCFDWGTLFDKEYHGGHVCVIDRIYDSYIRIIDPEYKEPKWKK